MRLNCTDVVLIMPVVTNIGDRGFVTGFLGRLTRAKHVHLPSDGLTGLNPRCRQNLAEDEHEDAMSGK